MEKVISDEKGTGKGADPLNVNAKVFGKTGTAENPMVKIMHGLLVG